MTQSALYRVIAAMVALLWLKGVASTLVDLPPALSQLAVLPLAAMIVCALLTMVNQIRILCIALAIATGALAGLYDQWDAILPGLERATIFPAFLATIVLLRATADQRPEIAAARRLFSALGEDERGGGVTVGAFLLGSVLQVGQFAIFAPIVGRDAPVEERRRVFMSALRGMALVPFWSPFIVATAVAAIYLPEVPVWQTMILGLTLAAIAMLMGVTMLERVGGRLSGPAVIWRALATLAPVMPSIAVAALIVVGATVLTDLTTLQALVIAMPVPCVLAVLFAKGGDVRAAARATVANAGRIGPETSILVFAMTLGLVFEACLPQMGLGDWLESLSLGPFAIILIVIMSINLAGLCGIHPIVSGAIVLVLFTGIPTGLADVILMQAMLVGWGLCSSISIGSLSIAAGAAMFDLSPEGLVTRDNLVFVLTASILIAVLLWLLNGALIAWGVE
jgi:hypothetical protein